MKQMNYSDPIYGKVRFNEVEKEIIQNPGMQRLKKIHANGADYLVNPNRNTSRFEHSLGTGILCKVFGEGEEEVIAGLVHDISHTVFSHLVDQVYEREDQTFHEDHHSRFVRKYGLDELVEEHGYDPSHVLNEENFPVLEKELPDLCTDRVDYTLRDLYKYGSIDRGTVRKAIEGLVVEGGVLIARDLETAKSFTELSIKLNKDVFFNEKQEAANVLMKEIINDALDKEIITESDFFKTDEEIIGKIKSNEELSKKFKRINNKLEVGKRAGHDKYRINRKHRIVDPLVRSTGSRVSELDKSTREKIEDFRENVPRKISYDIKTVNVDD